MVCVLNFQNIILNGCVNEPDIFDEITNMRFDFVSSLPPESALRKEQKEFAQKVD